MQALYTAGDARIIVRALRIIDASSLYYHSQAPLRRLAELRATHGELTGTFGEAFDAFSVDAGDSCSTISAFPSAHTARKYTRSSTIRAGRRVRFACLRYLVHIPIRPPTPILLRYATPRKTRAGSMQPSPRRCWRAIGAETAAVLERRTSIIPNWYIRFNASKSLRTSSAGSAIDRRDPGAQPLRLRESCISFDVRELEERKEDAVCTTV